MKETRKIFSSKPDQTQSGFIINKHEPSKSFFRFLFLSPWIWNWFWGGKSKMLCDGSLYFLFLAPYSNNIGLSKKKN